MTIEEFRKIMKQVKGNLPKNWTRKIIYDRFGKDLSVQKFLEYQSLLKNMVFSQTGFKRAVEEDWIEPILDQYEKHMEYMENIKFIKGKRLS